MNVNFEVNQFEIEGGSLMGKLSEMKTEVKKDTIETSNGMPSRLSPFILNIDAFFLCESIANNFEY